MILWSLALAGTPDWVKEVDGQTEICAISIEGDPTSAQPPPITTLQALRRDPAVLGGALRGPTLGSLSPQPAAIRVEASRHPLRPGWSVVRVEAAVAPVATAVEQHLTVAVDTSGSMSSASFRALPLLLDEPPPETGAYRTVNRLDLTKEILHELVDGLEGEDMTFALVAFHRENAVALLEPTPVADKPAMHAAIDRIDSKAVGNGGLMSTLYQTAAKAFTACADDRVLMFTDDNPQIQGDPKDIRDGVRAWATQGLQLNTFAVGTTADLTPIAQLTAAGGGELQRIDTVAEGLQAVRVALRPTGSPVSEPSITVRFPGAWEVDGSRGQGREHTWVLPQPMVSDWTGVQIYEVEGGAGVEVTFAAASPIPGEWSRQWTDRSGAPGPLTEASYPMRHDAAFLLAEAGLRQRDRLDASIAALAGVVREVGPGREAQALLERAR